MPSAEDVSSSHLEADAFKRIYPEQYFEKFLEHGVRPDGRPLATPRPLSIAHNAVTSADASALVKIGSTTAIAGIKCEVMAPIDDRPNEGQVIVQIEMAPLASADARPGRPCEEALVLTDQIATLISSDVLDLKQLCIDPGNAAWAAYLDIYILDADGSLYDACLIAALAALRTLHLPRVELDEHGSVQPASTVARGDTSSLKDKEQDGNKGGLRNESPLELHRFPVSLTCGMHKGQLLVDPTAEEEKLVESLVTVVVDEEGEIMRLSKPGGRAEATMQGIRECHEAAKARSEFVRSVLKSSIESHEMT